MAESTPTSPVPLGNSGTSGQIRDGLLYLAIAHGALILGGACLFMARDELIQVESPLGIMGVTLLSAWSVLALLGFEKIMRANRHGAQSRWTLVVQGGLAIYSLAILSLILHIAAQGSEESQRNICLLVLVAFSGLLGHKFVIIKRPAMMAPGIRPLRWLGLSALWLCGAFTLSSVNLFRQGWDIRYLRTLANPGALAEWLTALLLLSSLAAGTAGLLCLWRERFESQPQAAVRWSRRAGVLWAAGMAFVFLSTQKIDDRVNFETMLAGYLAMLIGAGTGWLLAQIRSKGISLWWRYAFLCLPLGLALGYFGAVFYGTVSYIRQATNTYRPMPSRLHSPRPWVWHQPEQVRRFAVNSLTIVWPQMESGLSITEYVSIWLGLSPVVDLEAAAHNGKLNVFARRQFWLAWYCRVPASAISKALETGETNQPGIPLTSHDDGAGYLIGLAGQEDIIRKKLSGNYSNAFQAGLLAGIIERGIPSPNFNAEISALLERQSLGRESTYNAIRILHAADSTTLEELTQAWVNTPTPQRMAALPISLNRLAIEPPRNAAFVDQLTLSGLRNNDPAIREIFLSVFATRMGHMQSTLEWKLQLECARGSLPGATAKERALAIAHLERMLSLEGLSFPNLWIPSARNQTPTKAGFADLEQQVLRKIEKLEANEEGRPAGRPSSTK